MLTVDYVNRIINGVKGRTTAQMTDAWGIFCCIKGLIDTFFFNLRLGYNKAMRKLTTNETKQS